MHKKIWGCFDFLPKTGRLRCCPGYKSWLSIACITVLLLIVAAPVGVMAQTAINVTLTSVKVDYPQSMTFSIQAQSTSNITKLALRYRLDRQTCVTNIVNEAWPDFTPATRVDTSWVWQMKKTGGLPPGAKLTYSWLVVDAKGQQQESPWIAASFDDSRNPWQSVSDGMLTLYWYQGDKNFANTLLTAGTNALKKAALDTGAKLERPVKIYVYSSTDALQSARVFAPAWEGGVAFPDYGIIAIGVSVSQLAWGQTTVAHELTHVLTFQLTQKCYGQIPTWLNEGLSTYSEGPLEASQQVRLQRAVTNNALFSVRTLSGAFPAQSDKALLSYAESYSLVNYLLTKYGGAKMLTFEAAFKDGLTQDEALTKVYGLDADKLDAEWRASVGAPPRESTATPAPSPSLTPRPATPTPAAQPTTAATTPPAVSPTPVATTPPPSPIAMSTTPLHPTPTATPTPETRKGLFSCSHPAAATLPAGGPDWWPGLMVFGVTIAGAFAFGWMIRSGRR